MYINKSIDTLRKEYVTAGHEEYLSEGIQPSVPFGQLKHSVLYQVNYRESLLAAYSDDQSFLQEAFEDAIRTGSLAECHNPHEMLAISDIENAINTFEDKKHQPSFWRQVDYLDQNLQPRESLRMQLQSSVFKGTEETQMDLGCQQRDCYEEYSKRLAVDIIKSLQSNSSTPLLGPHTE